MGRVTQVFNRNGEIVPFRRNRIVRAILAAVRTAGSKDEWVADKLADMVVYFLDMQHGDGATPPQAEDVDDMIEKALLSSPDLHPIAQAFIAGRQQRREIRELEENVSSQPAQGPQVAQPDQGLGGWNPARIAAAVMRENSLDATIAGEVAAAVERKMHELKLPLVTTGLIRELVDVELLSRGLITEPGSVSIPRFDLEQWVFPGEDTDVPPVTEQAELSERASRRVLSQYALHSILPAPVREAHIDGRLQFEALHAPAAVVGTRLDVAALLGAGAGFGLQRMFAESTAGIGAALARLANTVGATAAFTSGPVTLKGLDRALALQAQDDPEQIQRSELQDGLRLLTAQVPGGLVIEVGPPTNTARDIVARTLIDTLAAADGSLRKLVRLELTVTPGAFADPARRSLLERAATAASYCGTPVFRLREPANERPTGLFGELGSGLSHEVVIARAAINLVRPALQAPSLDAYLKALDPSIDLAVDGLAARAGYLERVAMRDIPEPIPASSRMLRALVGASRDVELSPLGLGLVSALLSGVGNENDPGAQRTAQQILSYLAFKFRERAGREGLNGRLGVLIEPTAAPRCAREDTAQVFRTNPDSALRVQLSREGAYGDGATLDDALPIQDRLDAESALHSLLGRDATIRSSSTESLTAPEILELVRRCVSERGPKPSMLEVNVSSRTCRDCGARYPASRDACPVCDSTAWALPPGQKSLFQ
ncbi:MAG: ATP cone domain-containing protein [Planctomycetota bacterium]